MQFKGSKTLLPASPEFVVPGGYVITYISPLNVQATLQAAHFNGILGSDRALDGTYTPATDANASTVLGAVWGRWSKVKMATTGTYGVEIFWEEV